MSRLVCWPPEVPEPMAGLREDVGERLGRDVEIVSDDLAAEVQNSDFVLAVIGGDDGTDEAIEWIARGEAAAVVFVVSDGHLGTDDRDVSTALAAASAVAAARSMAIRPGGATRANVVSVAASLFGDTGSQRGPLRTSVELRDVVEAVTFFLDAASGYLSGQVLFVDGGRHVFSSMSA